MAEQIIEVPYRPRPLQKELHDSRKRFGVYVCHRRFGKTVWAINELVKGAIECPHERPRLAYITPLFKQAKQVAWDYLKHFAGPLQASPPNESELRVDLLNGARIQLFGGDNPDALRGLYLDGVVLDEYAQMSPRLWSEVIRPALSDRKGWAAFIGTPMGHNHFHDLYEYAAGHKDWVARTLRASETGVVDPEELESARETMGEDEYEQEYECSWSAAIRGAYYGKVIANLEGAGRFASVPVNPAFPVHTAWDIGTSDDTAIWFFQTAGPEIHIVDYYVNRGFGADHYAKVLQNRGYVYGDHYVPHDAEQRSWAASGRTARSVLRNLGVATLIAPRESVSDGINAVRQLLPRCWFDKEKCAAGIDALRQYRREWDDKKQVFKDNPLHDWASHPADAFRYLALAYKAKNPDSVVMPITRQPTLNELLKAHDEAQPRRVRI